MKLTVRVAPYRAKKLSNVYLLFMLFALFGILLFTQEQQFQEQHDKDGFWLYHHHDVLQRDEIQDDSTLPMAWESRIEDGLENVLLDGVWQPVGDTRFRFYVYSAFVEKRTVPSVRVIAATKTHGADAVICRLWLSDNRTLTLKTQVQAIKENFNLQYTAVFVLCLLNDTDVKPEETVGASVSILAASAYGHPPTNRLTVLDTEQKSGIEDTLHVCVKPFYHAYSRDDWLVEWFELNRLLGASHFYMYDHSLSPPVACLLNHYRQQGLVTLLPWTLPFVSRVEIRTEGQFAAFNDCLYRSMSSAGWLLVIDVDEVVFPRSQRNLSTLLSALRASNENPENLPAEFLFRNAFFYLNWEDDEEAPAPLLTARKTRRWDSPHIPRNRSKYAVRPRDVVELGNHFAWEHMPGTTSEAVSMEKALLHHYREECEYEDTDCLTVPSTIDRTAHKWSKELQMRVVKEKKIISLKCR